jgi:hypothetical protein
MNPYLSQFAPQVMQQDIYGPSQMMDTTARQLAQDAANKQGAQLGQQALGINKNPMSGVDPIKLGMALRQMNQPYGGTPQGAYGQQNAYMRSSAMLPLTDQQQKLSDMSGGLKEFMSFDYPMPSGS